MEVCRNPGASGGIFGGTYFKSGGTFKMRPQQGCSRGGAGHQLTPYRSQRNSATRRRELPALGEAREDPQHPRLNNKKSSIIRELENSVLHFLPGISQKSWGHWGQMQKHHLNHCHYLIKMSPKQFGDKRFCLGTLGTKMPKSGKNLMSCTIFERFIEIGIHSHNFDRSAP